GLALPTVVHLGYYNRSADNKPPVLVARGSLCLNQLSCGIQALIVVVVVSASVKGRGSRLGRVCHEAAAGAPVLRGEIIGNDLRLLNRIKGDRSLLRVVMVNGAAKGSSVEVILHRHGLAAVHTRLELAPTEDGAAVRPHRNVARLRGKEGLCESDISTHHDWQVAVELLAQNLRDFWIDRK